MNPVEVVQKEFPGMDEITAKFTLCILHDIFDLSVFEKYREDCRSRKDFKTSDWIRDQITAKGIRVRDRSVAPDSDCKSNPSV